ncbi:MAG: cation transporter [Clostridia bacterium]|nr:cation transporter [Clostridia bacterium]
MGNYIIIFVIAVILSFAVFSTAKHFKGEGGCCGGSAYQPKKKKLSGVKYQKIFKIGGLHCKNCKNRVEEAVNDIRGIAGKVDLKSIVTDVFDFDDIQNAMDKSVADKANIVKAVVKIAKD